MVYEKRRSKPFDGQIIMLYAVLYSVERFFVEGLRTDSLWIGSLRQAQVISICIFVLGIAGYFILKSRGRKAKLSEDTTETAEAPAEDIEEKDE